MRRLITMIDNLIHYRARREYRRIIRQRLAIIAADSRRREDIRPELARAA